MQRSFEVTASVCEAQGSSPCRIALWRLLFAPKWKADLGPSISEFSLYLSDQSSLETEFRTCKPGLRVHCRSITLSFLSSPDPFFVLPLLLLSRHSVIKVTMAASCLSSGQGLPTHILHRAIRLQRIAVSQVFIACGLSHSSSSSWWLGTVGNVVPFYGWWRWDRGGISKVSRTRESVTVENLLLGQKRYALLHKIMFSSASFVEICGSPRRGETY